MIFTISKHLFEHCLAPIGVHGNMLSCSCIRAGCPTGGVLDPFLNCPLRKTPHVQKVWSTVFNFSGSMGTGSNDLSLFHSKSMVSLTVGVEAWAVRPESRKQQQQQRKKSKMDLMITAVVTSSSICSALIEIRFQTELKILQSRVFKWFSNVFPVFYILIWNWNLLWLWCMVFGALYRQRTCWHTFFMPKMQHLQYLF